MRPILSTAVSVNHMLPSGPAVMRLGCAAAVGTEVSVTVPLLVILATLLPLSSVNHRLPSAPAAMPVGALAAVMPVENSVTGVVSPEVAMLAILAVPDWANHVLPCGAVATPLGALLAASAVSWKGPGFFPLVIFVPPSWATHGWPSAPALMP